MTDISKPVAILRPMTEADLGLVFGWRNHPDIRRHMYNQKQITFADHSRWFKTVSIELNRHLLILDVDSVSIGYVNFNCDDTGEAIWGFYMAPDAPKGTGMLLGKAATNYAFCVLKLKRIWGEVLPGNLSSQNFHLRQGFVLESILPEKTIANLTIGNVHRYLLTREAWLLHKEHENEKNG